MATTYTPPYHTASKVRSVVEEMQTIERYRAGNRSLVNNLFNGGRPWSADQEKKLQIQFNVNWGEGGNMLQRANTQINGALLHKGYFFTSKCLRGKVEKRDEWSQAFVENIHKPLKRGKSGKRHMFLMRNRNAALTLHGIGPMMWMNDYEWMPRFVPLEDLLIPTDTDLDFYNLTHFSVSRYPTPYELFEMTHGENAMKGWNMKAVRAILAAYKDLNANPFNYDWYNQPEKMAELWKQNRVPCDNDSVPVVRLIYFFYRSTESSSKNEKWNRKIILREMPSTPTTDAIKIDEFLFEQEGFSDDIDKILHVQFGDSSLVPPLKYQSVRGLGTALYSVIETMNRLRCQFAQHVFEQFLMYFRITNPAMQDRPKQLQLFPFGVIPDGLSIVPHNERHRIDPGLVDRIFAENRQLMSENSASFVQDIDKGQQGNPITATEAQIRLQNVNVLVSSMLNMLYTQENFYYEEIVRRFLTKTPREGSDEEQFQKRCAEAGIPKELMVPSNWQIDAERVFGGGDQMLAEQEVTKLLQLAPQLDPTAQRMIRKQYVTVITRDPAKGELYVPENPDQVTDGRRKGEIMFGVLMADGLPRSIPEGIEREDYIATLIQMAEAKMMTIQQSDNVGSPQELAGLQAVLQHANENVEILAQDQTKKPLVKMFTDALGNLENILKGFAQRLEQQIEESQQQPPDPAAEAKAQATVQQAVIKARISMANAQQKIQQSQQKFQQQMTQQLEKHKLDLANSHVEMRAKLLNDRVTTAADIENKRKMAAAAPASNGAE